MFNLQERNVLRKDWPKWIANPIKPLLSLIHLEATEKKKLGKVVTWQEKEYKPIQNLSPNLAAQIGTSMRTKSYIAMGEMCVYIFRMSSRKPVLKDLCERLIPLVRIALAEN